jgi:2-keto-3-deoxy-L-rhamnonate aldolase RhmA
MHHLTERLIELKETHSLIGIKAGTEVEAMNFDEIALMRSISTGVLPMILKIGGPEARNDISFGLAQHIDYILAPMIESVYGLKNFVETMKSLDKTGIAGLGVNIETVTAFENLPKIFSSSWFRSVDKITVGRSDLSSSLNLSVDAHRVTEATLFIVSLARKYGKTTSVGGQVTPENARAVTLSIKPDSVNTRHMVVACSAENISLDVQMALEWEKDFYQFLFSRFPARRQFYLSRMESVEARIRQGAVAV